MLSVRRVSPEPSGVSALMAFTAGQSQLPPVHGCGPDFIVCATVSRFTKATREPSATTTCLGNAPLLVTTTVVSAKIGVPSELVPAAQTTLPELVYVDRSTTRSSGVPTLCTSVAKR